MHIIGQLKWSLLIKSQADILTLIKKFKEDPKFKDGDHVIISK